MKDGCHGLVCLQCYSENVINTTDDLDVFLVLADTTALGIMTTSIPSVNALIAIPLKSVAQEVLFVFGACVFSKGS